MHERNDLFARHIGPARAASRPPDSSRARRRTRATSVTVGAGRDGAMSPKFLNG